MESLSSPVGVGKVNMSLPIEFGGGGVSGVILSKEREISSSIIIEGLTRSWKTGDINRGIPYYLRLLNRHLDLHLKFTKQEVNEHLLPLLVAMVIHPQLDVELQAKLANSLATLLQKYKKEITVTIEWKPLLHILVSRHLSKSRTAEYSGRVTEKYHAFAICKLIQKARRFFGYDSAEHIMIEFRSYFCPHDTSLFKYVALLGLFLPVQRNLYFNVDWISELLTVWSWVGNSPGLDQIFIALFARIAKHQRTINWDLYSSTIFTHFNRITDVAVGSSKLPKPTRANFPTEATILVPFHTSSFSSMGKMMVYMISPDNGIFLLLRKMFSILDSFFHPSNSGNWTDNLGILLRETCGQYSKRRGSDQLLGQFDVEFVGFVLPFAILGIYSKSNSMTTSARTAIKHLCHIKPDLVFPRLIESFFAGLETLTATHQTLSGIETLATVAGSLVSHHSYPDGAQHLSELLSLTLPGIDTNDPEKTKATIKFYYRLLSYITLVDESSSPVDDSTKAVTAVFHDWAVLFLDKIFNLLGNKDKDEKGSDEWWWKPLLRLTFKLLFAQSSDITHTALLKKLHTYLTLNVVSNASKEFGYLVEAVTAANPTKVLQSFVPSFYTLLVKESTNQVVLQDLSENELLWHLNSLRHVVLFGGKALLHHSKQLLAIINASLNFTKSKQVIKSGARLLRNLLLSLSTFYPLNARSLPEKLWQNSENLFKTWGTEFTYSTAEIEWHSPTQDELSFACQIVTNYCTESLNKLQEIMHKRADTQGIWRSLIVLRYTLRGSATILPWPAQGDKTHENDNNAHKLKHVETAAVPLSGEWQDILLKTDLLSVVGSTIHELCNFLLLEKGDDTVSVKQLCQVYSLYLSFRGVFTDKLQKKRGFNSMLKAKYANHLNDNKFQSRSARVESAYIHYLRRLDQRNYGLPLTSIGKELLNDLFRLSTHPYLKVRSKAQSVLVRSFKHIPSAAYEVLPAIITKLSEKTSDVDSHQTEGIIHLLSSKTVQRKIIKNWSLLSSFILSLCKCYVHEKFLLQAQIYKLFITFCVTYHAVPVEIHVDSSNVHLSKLNAMNVDIHRRLVSSLVQMLQTPLHWKYQIIASTCLVFLFRVSIMPDLDVFKWFLRGLVSDIAPLRSLSNKAVSMLLTSLKPNQGGNLTSVARVKPEDWGSLPAVELTKGTQTFYDKNFFGFNGKMTVSKVSTSKDITLYIQVLHSFFADRSFTERFLQYLAQDHKPKGETSNNDRFSSLLSGFQNDSRMMGMMSMFGNVAQSLAGTEEQAASEVIKELQRPHKLWPHTRAPKISTGFLENNSQLWKGIMQIGGYRIVELLQPNMKIEAENLEEACTKAEFFAGMIRASAIWDLDTTGLMWQYSIPLLDLLLSQSSAESLAEWHTALRFATYDLDPRRLGPIVSLLFSDPLKGSTSSAHAKRILFAKALVIELSWRAPQLNVSLLSLLSEHMEHSYKQVRHAIGETIATIFFNLWVPVNSSSTETSLVSFYEGMVTKLRASQTPGMMIEDDEKAATHYRETVLHFLTSSLTNGEHQAIMPYIAPLLPVIFEMQRDKDEEISKLAGNVNALLCQAFFPQPVISSLLASLEEVASNPNWHIRSAALPFLQVFTFNHTFILDADQIQQVYKLSLRLLGDAQLEVRELARIALSSIIRSAPTDLSVLFSTFYQMAVTPIDKRRKNVSADESLIKRHAGICGLCAMIESTPYDIPSWLPNVLEKMSPFVNDPAPIQETVKKTYQEFWRTHQDMWEQHQTKFTEDQLYTINELLISPTYYA